MLEPGNSRAPDAEERDHQDCRTWRLSENDEKRHRKWNEIESADEIMVAHDVVALVAEHAPVHRAAQAENRKHREFGPEISRENDQRDHSRNACPEKYAAMGETARLRQEACYEAGIGRGVNVNLEAMDVRIGADRNERMTQQPICRRNAEHGNGQPDAVLFVLRLQHLPVFP